MMFRTLQLSIRCLRCTNVLRPQNIKTVSLIAKQSYGGWLHRRPSAVVNEEIVLDDAEELVPRRRQRPRKFINEEEEEEQEEEEESQKHVPLKARPPKHPKYPKKVEPVSTETLKEDGKLNFVKLGEYDRKLSALMLTIKSRNKRDKSNQILLEGTRLIVDAMKAGIKPEMILFSRTPDVMKLPLPESNVKLYKIPYKTLQLWSNLTTSPGIMGVFKMPESFERDSTIETIPLTIICDNVREPGNLGSILRAAAGVGCERVILTKGCVDVWESKVLRSASGGHFRVSISKSMEWEDITALISPTAKIYAADNNAMSRSTEEVGKVDDTSMTEASDEESAESVADQSEAMNDRETRKYEKISSQDLLKCVPSIPYYATDYTASEAVLIVGGESEGLSYESVEFLRNYNGVRVNIPMTNGMESLNTGMALGIVAFEIKKQFAIKKDSLLK